MRGQSSKIAPSYEVQTPYRGTLNAYMAISDEGLTKNNKGTAQAQANTTLGTSTPDGILGGMVVRVVAAGQVGPADAAATGVQAGIVGIAKRDAAGAPYESLSSVASGGITYVHGSTTVVEVPVYETHNVAGDTPLDYASAAGQPVYASANALLTIAEGLTGGVAAAGATVIGTILVPPTASNPIMVVQLRF